MCVCVCVWYVCIYAHICVCVFVPCAMKMVRRYDANASAYTCAPCVSNCGWVPSSDANLKTMAQAVCSGTTSTLNVAGGPGTQPIGLWNVSSITTMSQVFKGCTTFNQDISQWNIAGVTNLNSMFHSASAFNQDLMQWNTASVTNFNVRIMSLMNDECRV